MEWDAWRRPDGRWALVASYAVDGRPRTAEFTHDLPGRYVVADNDEAKILTGEVRAPGGPAATAAQTRRLSPVPSQDELPLGDDAIELVRDRANAAADDPSAPAEVADPTADTADGDWLTDTPAPAPDDVPLIEEPAQEPVAEPAAETTQIDETEHADETEEPEEAAAMAASPAGEDEGEPTPQEKPASKRKGRSSVPSWDEIMFGGSAKED